MFEIGRIYNRRKELHKIYKGQQQGGISTPANFPFVLIFTGDSGNEFGYHDEFRTDGLYWYTGEGQSGDMEMKKGNLAIYEHEKRNKKLYLFEYVRTGNVRYLGETVYVGHHIEDRFDKNDVLRKVIIFHLALKFDNGNTPVKEQIIKYKSNNREALLLDLKIKALYDSSLVVNKKEIISNIKNRSNAIKKYVLVRANGVCEGCLKNAPFKTINGPYLEAHHVHRLSDGGPDHPEHVVALCPNCHREVHFGKNGNLYNNDLIQKLKLIENLDKV